MNLVQIAQFSDDRIYRWWLLRVWDENLPLLCSIGLNPSIADEEHDDNTISLLINYSKRWGMGGLFMQNLYAYCSTDPVKMFAARRRGVDIVGNENYVTDILQRIQGRCAGKILAAWGTKGGDRGSDLGLRAKQFGIRMDCIFKTKAGHPHHPLYLPSGLSPIPWNY